MTLYEIFMEMMGSLRRRLFERNQDKPYLEPKKPHIESGRDIDLSPTSGEQISRILHRIESGRGKNSPPTSGEQISHILHPIPEYSTFSPPAYPEGASAELRDGILHVSYEPPKDAGIFDKERAVRDIFSNIARQGKDVVFHSKDIDCGRMLYRDFVDIGVKQKIEFSNPKVAQHAKKYFGHGLAFEIDTWERHFTSGPYTATNIRIAIQDRLDGRKGHVKDPREKVMLEQEWNKTKDKCAQGYIKAKEQGKDMKFESREVRKHCEKAYKDFKNKPMETPTQGRERSATVTSAPTPRPKR